MNKKEAITLLNSWGWTQADAKRALENLDFSTNPGEAQVLRYATQFSGSELATRQRLQAAQKSQVTLRKRELEAKEQELVQKDAKIHELVRQVLDLTQGSPAEDFAQLQAQLRTLEDERDQILASKASLKSQMEKLTAANDLLMQDNRRLRNLVDQIRLQVTREMKGLLRYQDSEIRQAVVRLFQKTVE